MLYGGIGAQVHRGTWTGSCWLYRSTSVRYLFHASSISILYDKRFIDMHPIASLNAWKTRIITWRRARVMVCFTCTSTLSFGLLMLTLAISFCLDFACLCKWNRVKLQCWDNSCPNDPARATQAGVVENYCGVAKANSPWVVAWIRDTTSIIFNTIAILIEPPQQLPLPQWRRVARNCHLHHQQLNQQLAPLCLLPVDLHPKHCRLLTRKSMWYSLLLLLRFCSRTRIKL